MLLDVTLEVDFGTLWKETLATFLTATAKCVASGLSAHAGTETVLTLANSLGWLISTFHGKMWLDGSEPLICW